MGMERVKGQDVVHCYTAVGPHTGADVYSPIGPDRRLYDRHTLYINIHTNSMSNSL
jgi:hypothetical protein